MDALVNLAYFERFCSHINKLGKKKNKKIGLCINFVWEGLHVSDLEDHCSICVKESSVYFWL